MGKVPLIDAQADTWFLEARALESPEIYVDRRDYKKIVQLTTLAAERRHWKAMLNLASLYLEGHDPGHGVEDALRLVEEAMRLGVPAAYDRMGTYHMNGTGVGGDLTRAYAFWQRAAEMGSPLAMAYLAEKLRAGTDDAMPGYWANIPVATKMLECSLAQGHGPAAYILHFIYEAPRDAQGYEHARTRETKARALQVLHDGARLGCGRCAHDLAIEFSSPIDLADMLVPHLDKARSERYLVLAEALDFDPDDRFPNLDLVLPLPPAMLSPWNGDRDTLLNAARGVTPTPLQPQPITAAPASNRYFLDSAFALQNSGQRSEAQHAPFAGYWKPIAPQLSASVRAQLADIPPGLYRQGEPFQTPAGALTGIEWEWWQTTSSTPEAIAPRAAAGLTRVAPRPQPLRSSPGDASCPASGVWQPWLSPAHPLHAAVNQYWRQRWLTTGQPFPRPQTDWQLPLREQDLTWHLMDSTGARLLASVPPDTH